MNSQTATTRAAYIERFGSSAEIKVGPLPVDQAGPGQVRVSVRHSAVNPVDLGIREGRVVPPEAATFPMILGWDAEGEVDQLGSDVEGLKVGDYVYLCTQQPATSVGAHADLVVIDADKVARAPQGWAGGAAAALGLAGITALQAVAATELTAGDAILINNPVGFVGQLAAQIAKASGMKVTGIAAPEHERLLGDLGIDEVIDSVTAFEGTADRNSLGVDGAVDLLGGPRALATFGHVKDGGRYSTVIPEWWIGGGQYTADRGITPVVVENNPNRTDLNELAALANRGQLKISIAQRYPLEALGQAHDSLGRPGVFGKIVIDH